MSHKAAYKKKLEWRTLHWVSWMNKQKEGREHLCKWSTNQLQDIFLSYNLLGFMEKVRSITRHTFSPSSTTVLYFISEMLCWLHQRASLALSRHHDGNSSHACQSGGADLWGHSEWRWHLRLSPLSPVRNGNHWAPENLRRAPVCTERPLVFTWRGCSDIVPRKSL